MSRGRRFNARAQRREDAKRRRLAEDQGKVGGRARETRETHERKTEKRNFIAKTPSPTKSFHGSVENLTCYDRA